MRDVALPKRERFGSLHGSSCARESIEFQRGLRKLVIERTERARLQAQRRSRLLGAAVVGLGVGAEHAAKGCEIVAAAVGLIDPESREFAVADVELARRELAARGRGVVEIGLGLAGRLR